MAPFIVILLNKVCPTSISKCLASNFRGHVSAELQRSRLFTTASAQSNSSDDDGEHDCTLHSIFSYVVLALPPALASGLRGGRHISAQLQRRRLFTTARAQRNGRNHC
jgi:hypothetical protein